MWYAVFSANWAVARYKSQSMRKNSCSLILCYIIYRTGTKLQRLGNLPTTSWVLCNASLGNIYTVVNKIAGRPTLDLISANLYIIH